jgi:recombination protein RecT
MSDYLDSLDRLYAACAEHGIEYILPAHGYVLGFAPQAIAQLKAHRLKREAKVKAAMDALPGGDLDAWVPLAYDDTPQHLWPVAKRSMLAHVERLQESR